MSHFFTLSGDFFRSLQLAYLSMSLCISSWSCSSLISLYNCRSSTSETGNPLMPYVYLTHTIRMNNVPDLSLEAPPTEIQIHVKISSPSRKLHSSFYHSNTTETILGVTWISSTNNDIFQFSVGIIY